MQEFSQNEQKNSRVHSSRKKGLVCALRCITINHTYKDFHHSIHNNPQFEKLDMNQIRRSYLGRAKAKKVSNVFFIKERNSFPRPSNKVRKSHNVYQNSERIWVQPKSITKKSKQKLIQCIQRVNRLPKLNNLSQHQNIQGYDSEDSLDENDFKTSVLRKRNLMGNNNQNGEQKGMAKKLQQRLDFKLIRQLKNSLKIKKKIITQKNEVQQVIKLPSKHKQKNKYLAYKAFTQSDKNRVVNDSYTDKISLNKQLLCRWQRQQGNQSAFETPFFES